MNAKSPAMPNEGWIVTVNETELPAFVPYYTGNGRLGVRVGPLVLDWDGEARPLLPDTAGISAGGTHAGSGFPWPLAGVAVLPSVGWKQYGTGCNGCMSPDNSYRFFHMGEEAAHNGVMMYDDGGQNKRMIPFTGLPGRRPQDDSWIPRWSSDVRFLTLNSPIGGEDADICFGEFDENFTKVVRWIRVTDRPGQDTKACCWIDPGLGRYEGEVPFTIAVPGELTPGGEEHPAHWRSNVSPRPSAGGWSKQRAGKEEDND